MMQTLLNEFAPSKYQQAIFNHVARALAEQAGNVVVSAVPGAGKTETLVQQCRRLPDRIRADVVAFGRRVADEMRERLPRGCASARTLHSVGFRAWIQMLGGADLGEPAPNKIRRITKWLTEEKGQINKWRAPVGKVVMVVNHARAVGLVPDGTPGMRGLVPDADATWLGLMDWHGIATDYPADVVDAARRVLRTSIEWSGRIVDFHDQLYMPALTDGVKFDAAPVVMVDELQDLDPLQRRMVTLMSSRSLFLGVGDRRQAIFGWRGAAADSMDRVVQELRCTELPLSVCYRCPTSHLALARQYAPEIEARPGAPEGLVDVPRQVTAADFKPGDVVVCRQKAPGVRLAYYLIKRRVPARVLGKDLGEGLLGFVQACRCTSIEALVEQVNRRTRAALSRARAADDESVALEALDREQTILNIADACETDDVAELERKISELFADDAASSVVTVSTIHRFKGGEADRVWWLDPHLCDEERPQRDWQRQEVRNLRFVALTRSRRELRLVSSEALQ